LFLLIRGKSRVWKGVVEKVEDQKKEAVIYEVKVHNYYSHLVSQMNYTGKGGGHMPPLDPPLTNILIILFSYFPDSF